MTPVTKPNPLYQAQALDIHIGEVNITQGFNFSINRGECWCLLGKNGIGKTTLLKTLAGLLPAKSGALTLKGQDLSTLSRKTIAQQIGLLFQEHHDPFPATVIETVLAGRHPHLHSWQWESPQDNELAKQALAFVGLSQFATRTLDTLSGGERRRVGLATLVAQAPALYLLDEPGNHLDLHQQTTLMQRLCNHSRQSNRALLMSVHDVNLAARLADHCILLMGEGNVIAGPRAQVMNQKNLQQLYGHPLEQLHSKHGPVWLPH